MKKDKVQQLSNLRGAENVLMISIVEGNGTPENPFEPISYIITKDGSILGKINREWMAR